jgi:hypothetical protein
MGEKNLGVYNVEFITIDIDSLSGTGAEPFPDAETGIQNKEGAVVVGQEDGSYKVDYDHLNDELSVVDVADGTDAAAGTDVGEVRIRVEGRR